ncbi:MAG: NAD-dependent epimerase/dehydratase family protein [Lentisphaerae bacterium]|nr:NAD-dependent epimerase/dehydratase family protein [Lentisphaerota bacterium]
MSQEPFKRVLITGGAGFVGSSIALRLKHDFPDCEVVCVDNLHRKGSELNVPRLSAAGVSFVRADVRNREAFDGARYELIIDAAAEPSVMAGVDGIRVDYVVDTNLGGTLNVLEAARRCSAAVMFLSTSRVYAVNALRAMRMRETDRRFELSDIQEQAGVTVLGVDESFDVDGAKTLYGATKYASEVMVREYGAQFGLRVAVNRCGVIAGPWQMGRVDQGIIGLWVAAHIYGKRLKYIGYNGKQVRGILHIDDLCDLLLLQLAHMDEWDGRVRNVGGGREVSVSLLELTELCRTVAGRTIEIGYDDAVRPGDVPLYLSDTRKIRGELGWLPTRPAETIVEDVVKWIMDNKEKFRGVLT